MIGNKNHRFKRVISMSFKFMIAFIILSVIYLSLNIVALNFLSGEKPIYEYIPIGQIQEPTDLNWESIHKMGGYGYVVDNEGNVVWISQESKDFKKLSVGDILKDSILVENDRSTFTYKTQDGNYLILNYPSETLTNQPTYEISTSPIDSQRILSTVVIVLILFYILGIFFIFHKLSKNLEKTVQEEEEDKRFFFRGIAHDIKTPLATIMAYSKAINDGIVKDDQTSQYLNTIYYQSNILKNRVDDMMLYATLEEHMEENMQKNDLLEAIRRYVGENYSWFSERNAKIDIRFKDDESYNTTFDSTLFSRLLQNILSNSVLHNNPGVCIYIDWDIKEKCLILGDDGKGIPKELQDNLFDPMVTGDKSRTGEHFRGMGLANVNRIVELHGWSIEYNNEFRIKIR